MIIIDWNIKYIFKIVIFLEVARVVPYYLKIETGK